MNNAEERFWKALESLNKEIRHLTDGWGRFVEGIVAPSAVKIFNRMGYKVSDNYHRRKVWKNSKVVAEFDTLLVAEKDGKRALIIGEAKTHCSSDDIKDFIETLQEAGKYFKEYKNYDIIGFVAGINYDKGASKFAIKNGLYVFRSSGDTMILDVPKDFKPKVWK